MKGSPLFRTALVLLALLLLVLPLRSLTNARTQATTAPPSPAAAAIPVRLTITSTTFPFRFQISHLGKTIWKGESTTSSSSKSVTMRFPSEGVDLVVEASWPEKKETAIRVEAVRGESAPIARTLWGTGEVNDVVTLGPSP
ncbi:MAG: hypothetical protein ACREIF_01430 [Chthoniobacterales bacterium]